MTTRKMLMLTALISIAPFGLAMAQTPAPTPQDTSPSAASSPSQREATSSQATEAPTNADGSPAAASSPHQEHATRTASKQAMKECVAKQQQDNQGMSAKDAKKACKQQMKGSG